MSARDSSGVFRTPLPDSVRRQAAQAYCDLLARQHPGTRWELVF